MKAKHTPGPWEAIVDLVRSEYGTNEGGVGGGGLLVADCSAIGMPGTANARLISAAPELLEACESVLSDACGNCVTCVPPECSNGCENLIRAKKAIAKAKGES